MLRPSAATYTSFDASYLRACPCLSHARDEINFHVQPLDGRTGRDVECGCYGEELEEWLTIVPRRTGTFPYAGHASPDNGWCRLNHFDAERLLIAVRDLMPAMETGTIPPRGDTAPITP